MSGRARLYCQKSAVILLEERGYIVGRARLYGGRAQLYCRRSAVFSGAGYLHVTSVHKFLLETIEKILSDEVFLRRLRVNLLTYLKQTKWDIKKDL